MLDVKPEVAQELKRRAEEKKVSQKLAQYDENVKDDKPAVKPVVKDEPTPKAKASVEVDERPRTVLCIRAIFAEAVAYRRGQVYTIPKVLFDKYRDYFVVKAIDKEELLATDNEKRFIKYIAQNMHGGIALTNIANTQVITQNDVLDVLRELETEG